MKTAIDDDEVHELVKKDYRESFKFGIEKIDRLGKGGSNRIVLSSSGSSDVMRQDDVMFMKIE